MKDYEVIIIGSGFSGLCAAIKLKENNIDNFIILERDEALGGTWWRNSYPGAAVDVPSRLYSFSFEKFSWSRLYAKRDEIYEYTKQLIETNNLTEKSRTNIAISSLHYDEKNCTWQVNLSSGESLQSKFIISATGGLSQPSIPHIPGLDSYKGKYFHSSHWEHDFDCQNKNIVVIGTGASSVQIVPELAKIAKKLYVIQRTPHWILPRPDRALKTWERKLLQLDSFYKALRALTFVQNESRALFFVKFPKLAKLVQLLALRHLKKQVPNKELRAKLIPNFDIGCKRVLVCNDYYPSLSQANVNLVTEGIDCFYEKGIQLKTKEKIEADLVVFATGFHASENAIPFEIKGKNNLSLSQYWKEGAKAYYGISVANFPNLFMAMGPNTGTGHTSVIYFIESQMNYIIDAIQKSKAKAWKSFEIKEEVQDSYNEELQEKMKNTIWMKGACKSWYLTKDGKNTTMYPDFSFVYRRNTKKFIEAFHHFEYN
ncbi:MAG: NAD(P)/FAD-dependent oxidoreductase [Chitinophagales bacterium]